MSGLKILSASGIEETAYLVTESVLRAALFKVVYEKICEDEYCESGYDSAIELQAELTVREILLRSLAQYLSGQEMQFTVKRKTLQSYDLEKNKKRINGYCGESEYAVEIFHSQQKKSLAVVEMSNFDFRKTSNKPYKKRNQSKDSSDRYIVEAPYQSDIANEKLIMHNIKETLSADGHNSIDLSLLESFRSIVCHGGYFKDLRGGGRRTSIMIIYGCQLPSRSTAQYDSIMNSLLTYVTQRIESTSPDDYVVVYIHGGSSKNRIPSFKWIRQAYVTINQKLKKNLKMFFVIHPSFLLRTTLFFCKPLLSLNFKSKLFIVSSISALKEFIPTDYIPLPDSVKQHEYTVK